MELKEEIEANPIPLASVFEIFSSRENIECLLRWKLQLVSQVKIKLLWLKQEWALAYAYFTTTPHLPFPQLYPRLLSTPWGTVGHDWKFTALKHDTEWLSSMPWTRLAEEKTTAIQNANSQIGGMDSTTKHKQPDFKMSKGSEQTLFQRKYANDQQG